MNNVFIRKVFPMYGDSFRSLRCCVKSVTLFISSVCCLLSSDLYAAGFQINEQSAANLGRANAGTAVTDDASIQFYNPAGMTQMTGRVASIAGAYIGPDINFRTHRSTNILGQNIFGNQNSPAVDAVVPSLYYIHPINSKLFAGIGVTAPFGLTTNYPDESLARYFGTKSKVQAININPSLAYKLNDYISIGAGVSVQRLEAELNQAVFLPIPAPVGPKDIFVNNSAHSWGYGWNAGVLFQVPRTKFGISYRSTIKHNLKGDTAVVGVPLDPLSQGFARFLGLVDRPVSSNITLPDTLTFSLSHDLTPRFTVLADAQYTLWSKIQNVVLTFAPVKTARNLPPSVLPFDYYNSWRVAIGQEYKLNERVKLRSGLAYDQSPVNQAHTTVRLPDADRVWLSVGTNIRLATRWLVDVGYTRLLFQPARVSQINPSFQRNQFLGDFYANANLFALQLTWEIDK